MRVVHRGGRPIMSYFLPKEREEFRQSWWRIRDAAAAWDCDRTTAKRLIDRHESEVGRFVVEVRTMYGQSLRVVIPKDTPRPGGLRGNPHFTEPPYQIELALRRWRPDEEPPRSVVAQRAAEARQRRAERRAARMARAYHAQLRQRLEQQRAQQELDYMRQQEAEARARADYDARHPERRGSRVGFYDDTGHWVALDQ